MTLFPSAFLPTIRYVSSWIHAKNPVVYVGEKYQKQTCRNRTLILSSQGVLPLIIPIRNGSSSHLMMKDAAIVYNDRWQQRYWHSLVSAYKNAPYFEHYVEELQPLWFQKDLLLIEYNQLLMSWLFRVLGVSPPQIISLEPEKYFDSLTETDFFIPAGNELSYKQVFSYKLSFHANLSVLDLLMNKGPESIYSLCPVKKNEMQCLNLEKD